MAFLLIRGEVPQDASHSGQQAATKLVDAISVRKTTRAEEDTWITIANPPTNQRALDRFLAFATNPRVLWLSFAAYLSMTLAFAAVMAIWDFTIIDEMWDGEQITAHIAAMSETQRQVHAVMTGTLDVAYPLAYGTWQAGMAARFLGNPGRWIALLSIACVPVDLIEGASQIALLMGKAEFLNIKLIATPIKLALFTPGLFLALVAGYQWFGSRRA